MLRSSGKHDGGAVEIQDHLLRARIGTDRRNVEPEPRPRSSIIGKECIADRGSALELGKVAAEIRPSASIGRDQPPGLAGHIDVAQQRI